MGLDQATATRELIHTRNIETRGWQRADGLWDIEGRLHDSKTYAFRNRWRGEVTPGEAIHDMWLRLTVDDGLEVKAIEAVTDDAPFAICKEVTSNYQAMVGVRIGSGWRKEISQRLGRAKGCTHLRELLGILGATAYQTIMPKLYQARIEATTPDDSATPPMLLNTCYAWGESSEMVREAFPAHYRPPSNSSQG